MTKPCKPVAVIAVQAPGSKIWHLQESYNTLQDITICGKLIEEDWAQQFGLGDDDRLCKLCQRRLEAALGPNIRITNVRDA
jgi:hypothetical protein